MISALVNGIIGSALTLMISTQILGLRWNDALLCVLGSNVSGMISVLTILKAERTQWIKRHIITRPLWTWVVFVGLYLGILLLIAKPLRDERNFLWLVLPVILSTGFTIMAFGPIQDRIVARLQRRSRLP